MLASLIIFAQGVYVPGDICPRGNVSWGKCPWGKCPGGICPGEGVYTNVFKTPMLLKRIALT